MGKIPCSTGVFRAYGAIRALKIQWVSKTVDYGMEEALGSIPRLTIWLEITGIMAVIRPPP